MSATPIVSAHSIAVTFGRTPVLRGIDLAVERGSWVSIIGPNGAGKSTLLRVVAGLIAVDPPVLIDGQAILRKRPRARARRIGYVPQNASFPPGMSLLDYVLLGRTPHLPPLGVESSSDVEIAMEALRSLDLTDLARRSVMTLSGGEAQRAALARAVAQQPEILLLDEPTSALDLGHQQEVLELVDRLRSDVGLTVIATMHDLSLAGEFADRLLLLHEGKILADGPPAEVLQPDVLATTYGRAVEVLHHDGRLIVLPRRREDRP